MATILGMNKSKKLCGKSKEFTLTSPTIGDDCLTSRYYFFKSTMKVKLSSSVLLFFVIIGCISCTQNETDPDPKPIKKRIEFSKEYKKLEVFEDYVKKIDQNKTLEQVESLFYTDSKGNTVEAIAWINEKLEIVKLKETLSLTNGKKKEHTFYFLNGLKTVSQEVISHYELTNPYFTEERVYYSQTGSVIETFGRYAKSSDLSSIALRVKPKSSHGGHDHQNALNIIKRMGDYETRFRGFEEAYERKFVVFGTENQTTTIAFNVETPIIKQLMSNEKKYFNQAIDVQFSSITEPDGFMFQALIDLKFPS
jgi:hypothetical protein